MAAREQRMLARWGLGFGVVGAALLAVWLLDGARGGTAAAQDAASRPKQEQSMQQQWNAQAAPPPIDAAQPAQFKTATFAVG
jgi:hypothetical protein